MLCTLHSLSLKSESALWAAAVGGWGCLSEIFATVRCYFIFIWSRHWYVLHIHQNTELQMVSPRRPERGCIAYLVSWEDAGSFTHCLKRPGWVFIQRRCWADKWKPLDAERSAKAAETVLKKNCWKKWLNLWLESNSHCKLADWTVAIIKLPRSNIMSADGVGKEEGEKDV